MIGAAVGPYRILQKLGEGGMGEVYLADDARLNRKVALKRLKALSTDAPETRARLLREARAAAGLTHPNIAAVHDVVDADGDAFIVQEYVEGETLAALLRRGPLSSVRAVAIATQLADALATAHTHGVVHRDLKPANVQVTVDGRAKILDFGVAKWQSATLPDAATVSADTSIARPGHLVGTPAYMAPEQLLGRPADNRSDIYSLGLILFEMIAGRRAFTDNDPSLAILSGKPPSLREVDPHVSARIGEITSRAMASDPGLRYGSAAELRDALVAAASPHPADAEPPGVTRRPWRRIGFAGAAVAAALVGLFVWRAGDRPIGAPDSVPIIAVLPLANLSANPADEQLGAGVAEVLISNLARLPDIGVVPRSATLEYAGRRDLGRVGRDLGATFLVGGGVQRANERLRVTINLVSADSALVVWSDEYDASTQEIFELQRRLAEGVTDALQLRLTSDERRRLTSPPTTSADAFAQYSAGRSFLDRPDVAGNVDRAIRLFESALEKDGGFALAHAGLGDARWAKYEETKDPVWSTRALASSAEALRLDPAQPQVRLSVATVYTGTGRHEEAIDELRRALRIQPNSDDAYRLMGEALFSQGRTNEAIEALRHAIELRPRYWANHRVLGRIYLRSGQPTQALEAYTRFTELQPDSAWGFDMRGVTYQSMGETALALENYRKAIELGATSATYSNVGTIHYDEGRFEEAAAAYREAAKLAPNDPRMYRNLGDTLVRLGRRPEAEAAYLRAIALTESLLSVNPRDGYTLGMLAVYEAKVGRRTDAARHIEAALKLKPQDGEVFYRKAIVHALAGEGREAVATLRQALQLGYSASRAREDDDLASIREMPEFERLISLPADGKGQN